MSSSEWQNRNFDSQSGTFVVEYDAILGGSNIDGVFGLSLGNATTWSELAVTTRFAPSGCINVRNGGVYTADTQVYYTGGETYHFRIAIDIPAHQYSVYVTEPNGSEQLIAQDCAFRTGQETVDSLDTFAVNSVTGTYQLMNFTASADAPDPLIPSAPADKPWVD